MEKERIREKEKEHQRKKESERKKAEQKRVCHEYQGCYQDTWFTLSQQDNKSTSDRSHILSSFFFILPIFLSFSSRFSLFLFPFFSLLFLSLLSSILLLCISSQSEENESKILSKCRLEMSNKSFFR